ncbi:fungal fruit body lectin [Mycena leptocephala]|nr:fungal fruit body lectin [Mycena leptocephala]
MSYKITLRVYQTNPNAYFRIVEKTVWNHANGGTWSESDGEQVLIMGGSGTSGILRFLSDTGEYFLVAIGVHNYKRWCDIVSNITPDMTGATVHPEYYTGGRAFVRERQLASYGGPNAQGRSLDIKFTVAEGNDLKAYIIIG